MPGFRFSWLSLCLTAPAQAAGPESARTLDQIEVRAAGLVGVAPFELPASIQRIDLSGERNRADVNLSEALGGVPGLLARDRQNYAQDTQISIRGFGARATFGVRGLRLYADGIPATMPDGQGQISHFSLAAGDRIDILRGPFSVLHGNASGGAIELWSADGGVTDLQARASVGRFDSEMLSARALGGGARVGYNLAASHFDTRGFRDHSAARRESANAKVHIAIGAQGRIDLLLNHFDSPHAQDPLGLGRAQVLDDPRQATAVARQFDTRKAAKQDQVGLRYEQAVGEAHALTLRAHAGRRDIEQFLAVPVAAQANRLSSGGVVDLVSDYDGLDARWTWRGDMRGGASEVVFGLNRESLRQRRRGYENFVGTVLGIRGTARRDERNRVENVDPYLQWWWQFSPRWSLLAGARHSAVDFHSVDRYVVAGNPDDSGAVEYRRTTPVAGLTFAANENLRLYAASGRGFETPTFNELSYRADGGAGLAFDLRPATSHHVELGAKWRHANGATLDAALFRADTEDELAVARNVGGRSSFRNVGRARRQGFELGASLPLRDTWTLDLAYTRLYAAFRDAFPICAGAGCTNPSLLVPAGSRIPGTARDQFFSRLSWRPGPCQLAAEAVALGPVSVNDVGSETAPGHVLLNLEIARAWNLSDGRVRAFARLDNAFDRRYIGSVIVNEGNARFYEPGPGSAAWVGVEWEWGR